MTLTGGNSGETELMGQESSRSGKRWLIYSFGVCAIVVACTAWPVFRNPLLEPDDYRYFQQVRDLKQDFFGNILKASVVENEWTQLWWINVHENVCFFRPIVVLSYYLDNAIHGGDDPAGLLSTNILIWLLCVLLAPLVYFRWLGPGPPFFVSSVLFASFFAHGEVMWYVSGRTDSIAALFFLGGLVLHMYGKEHPSLRWWAIPSFVLALLTKEMTVVLPGILFLSDRWIDRRHLDSLTLVKREWKLYALYGIIITLFFLARARIISGRETGYPYPYFVTFGNPDFFSRLVGQVNNYCANLFFAVKTVPFRITTEYPNVKDLTGLLFGIGTLLSMILLFRKEAKCWILLFIGLACWAPTIFLYQSERYLLLPSFAVAGALGLLLRKYERSNKMVYLSLLAVSAVWIVHQAYSLELKNRRITAEPRLSEVIGRQLALLKPSIPKASKLLLVNFPGNLLQDQFAEDELRAQLNDPDLIATIITPMPEIADMGAGVTVEKEGEDALMISDTELTPIIAQSDEQFAWVTLDNSSKYYSGCGITMEILDGGENVCSALRCVLPSPLSDYVLLKWDPGWEVAFPSRGKAIVNTPYRRELESRLRIVYLPTSSAP